MFEFKSGENNQYVEIVSIENVYISKDGGVTFTAYRNLQGLQGIEERIIHCDEWNIISLWELVEKYSFSLNDSDLYPVISDYPKLVTVESWQEANEYENYIGESTLAIRRNKELVME